MQDISIITAIDTNGLIGIDNHLPWQIKEDLQFFRETTMGHPVVMGKQTWLSIGKPLDGRVNIILTHDETFQIPGCVVLNSVSQVLSTFCNEEIFIIGGATIFEQFIPIANKIYLTRIEHSFKGDTYFPDVDWSEWKIAQYEKKLTDAGYWISLELWIRQSGFKP